MDVMPSDISIIAGCSHSVSWTRCFLYDLLDALHRDFMPFTRINSWVDDLSQRTWGTERIVADGVVECAQGLVAGAGQLRLRISAKSVVQATSAKLLKKIQTKLGEAGIMVQTVVAARDLGIDTIMGRRRTQKIAK